MCGGGSGGERTHRGIKPVSKYITRCHVLGEVAFVFTGLKKDGDRLGKGRCRSLLPEAAFWCSPSGNPIGSPLEVHYCGLPDPPGSLRLSQMSLPTHSLTQESLPL